jgi:hypothetical protein
VTGQLIDQDSACIDHDHKTGVVRGLVTSKVNLAIGLLDENPEFADHVAEYLRHHKKRRKSSALRRKRG